MQHAQVLLLMALIGLVMLIPLARTATHHTVQDGWLPDSAEAVQVQTLVASEFGSGATTYYLVFSSPTGTAADDPAFVQDVQYTVRPLRGHADVQSVLTWGSTNNTLLNEILISDDRHHSIAVVTMAESADSQIGSPDWVRAQLAPTDLQVSMTGLATVGDDFRSFGHNDLVRAELISLPITLALLLIIFRGIVPALLPVVMAAGSLIVALAAMAMLSRYATVNVFTVNAVTMLGLAVGIDYALIMMTRYREELRNTSPTEALSVTITHGGRTVITAGTTVAIGLSGLVLFEVPAATTTAILGAIVVLAAVAMALGVLPAALVLAGARLRPGRRTRVLPMLERVRERYPAITLACCLTVLAILTYPALHMHPVSPGIGNLPPEAESRATAETIQQHFPLASTSPIQVVIQSTHGSMLEPLNLQQYLDVRDTIASIEGVQRTESLWSYVPAAFTPQTLATGFLLQPELATAAKPFLTDRAALITVIPDSSLSRDDQQQLVKTIREQVDGISSRVDVVVGGSIGLDLDLLTYISDRIPAVLGWVFALTAFALFIHLRSVVLPVKAILMNLASMGASFGALVWLFQDGHLARWFGVDADGTTVILVPVLMFCFLFGLGMDFEIMMLSRIREAWLEYGDTTRAVSEGLAKAAGIVTTSAALMLAVFLSFAFGELDVIKALGIGLAIAVVIDATLVRLLLLPTTMQLMGRWNWWPGKREKGI